jgi:hypothetical protein
MKRNKINRMRLFQKSVMAGLTRHLLKMTADYQEIAGLRYATPAMTNHF